MFKLLCFLGIHQWNYKREKHPVIGHPSGRDCIRIPVRECKKCGHREQHMVRFRPWKAFDEFSEDAVINLKKFSEE
jgi:hypothetical protein